MATLGSSSGQQTGPQSAAWRRRLPPSLFALGALGLVGITARLLAPGGRAGETLLALASAALLCVAAFSLGRATRSLPRPSPAEPPPPDGAGDVLAALPEGVIAIDEKGRPALCNPMAERLLGGAVEHIEEHGLIPPGWRVVRDDGTPLTVEQHPASVVKRTGIARLNETLGLHRPDGSVVWLAVSTVPLPQASAAEPRRVVCTVSDITRQRQRDRALLAREAQILRALELAPFALWSVDGRGRLSFFAGTTTGHVGRWADLTGRPATELFPGAPEFAAHLRRALSGESFTALTELEGRSYETRFYPSRDPSGKIDGASGISIDVSERVAAEAEQSKLRDALRHAAEEWRTTFDAIDSPLVLLDADDNVRRVNLATRVLWNEPYESIIGARLPDDAPGLPWGAMLRAARQCRAAGKALTLQERDEASERYWDVTASLVAAWGARAVIVLARDVSDIAILRESLRRSERLSVMGELVSGVAHQVRNPLFAICATLDACEAEHGRRPELSEYTDALRKESAHLSQLMSHLLDYGKAARLVREPGSLPAVVTSAVAHCRALAREAGVLVEAAIPDDLPTLTVDEARLQEAVQNLIENAIQHSRRGGCVRVTLRLDAAATRATVHCDVEDDGPGFSAGDERHLFQPFFSRRAGGTGLGLSIAQRIVHEHGGSIRAGNRPSGGACVSIALPVAAAAAGAEERHA